MTHDKLIATLRDGCDIATKQRAIDLFVVTAGTRASLQSCSLSGIDLSGLCFAPLEFIDVEMAECLIGRTHFGTLSQCALDDSHVDSCDVVSIRDCTLNRAHLRRTSVQHEFHRNLCLGTTFEQVAFGGVWVAGRNAAIERSNFERATISESWLSGLIIDGCGFGSTHIVGSTLARASLRGCDLRGACATRCNLIDVSLDECVMEGMKSESCIARIHNAMQNRCGIKEARVWDDGGVDRLRGLTNAVVRGSNFRIKWIVRGMQRSAVSEMTLWMRGGPCIDGAMVWTRDGAVARMYPFEDEEECDLALANWWRDCADWVYVPNSLEVDSAEGSSEEVARRVEEVLRVG